ncbi:MAG: hypothetical protein NTX23_05930 [Candidatus Bipolaricaulota bacterium]|nr:hypothetical protein [Candidatus Bipolaricaulota bacterium]
MEERLEQLWGMASALRAEMAGSRLGLRLEELLEELEEYADSETVATAA